MIYKVTEKRQLNTCLDIISKSFQTVADEMGLTKENCPSHTAFMPLKKLQGQLKCGNPMFLYKYKDKFVGYFSLNISDDGVELNNLSVLPEYRHLGIGKELVGFAVDYSKNTLGIDKIKIGIVEENTVLKEWYGKLGFVHTGTKKFENLPFTVGFMELEI